MNRLAADTKKSLGQETAIHHLPFSGSSREKKKTPSRADRPRVIVAMSGGVDSSVAAALLLEAGYEVIGFTLSLTAEEESRPVLAATGEKLSALADAARIAEKLKISHHHLDWRERFRQEIICPFLSAYADGLTPNPCVICNQKIKFAALLEAAKAYDAPYIATGHYARTAIMPDGCRHLCRAKDEKKDQSYVLYRLSSETIDRLLLPLGEYTKKEVRALAEKYGLPVAQKPDSQDICFIPHDDYRVFLREHLPSCLKSGNIVDSHGTVLGRHEGVPLYTVGQRKGLGIAYSEPLYVKRLNPARNEVIVGTNSELMSTGLIAANISWTKGRPPEKKENLTAKIRYGHTGSKASLEFIGAGEKVAVHFAAPVRAVTPGQSVVFYDGDTVSGGGIIERPF